MGSAKRQAADEAMRQRVRDDLMAGIESEHQRYDAWGGKGFWTPKVKMTERDAGVVAEYVVRLLNEATP